MSALSRSEGMNGQCTSTSKISDSNDPLKSESQKLKREIEDKMSNKIFANVKSESKKDGDEVDSIGYQPSASEDDELRQSDSGASSKRQSWTNKSIPSAITPESGSPSPGSMSPVPQITSTGLNHSQSNLSSLPPSAKNRNIRSIQSALSPPGSASSTTGLIPNLSSHSHSGGEASASSSRSHLPLQSKTSLYRRQASAASSVSNEPFDDTVPLGYGGVNRGSQNLSRAKSISSVSSVNSTSSMEAAPFRAAPLGNVRMGFGGLPRGGLRGKNMMRSVANAQDGTDQTNRSYAGQAQNSDDMSNQANADTQSSPIPFDGTSSSQTEMTSINAPPFISPTKQKILPKALTNEWQYRNAPGMGSNRALQPLPHTISGSTRLSQPRAGIPSAFAGLKLSDDLESDESSLHSVQRPKPSIRSKLAKRAGKLGLKPLTSVNASMIRTNSPPPSIALDTSNLPQTNEGQSSGINSSLLVSAPLTPTARTSPEIALRNSKSYFGPLANSSTLPNLMVGNANNVGFIDNEMIRATTSSITNAPLVVPKHPPGPPGTGPPPSPGLVGSPANYMTPFAAIHATRVSPEEQDQDLIGQVSEINQIDDSGMSTPDGIRPSMNRPGSVSSGIGGIFSSLLGGGNVGGSANGHRNSFGPTMGNIGGRPPSRGSTGSPAPMVLTPAQKIQMEARAGTATVPSEPSGASPGPGLEGEEGDTSELSNTSMKKRPMSTSISTQTTARPRDRLLVTQRWSGANLPNDADLQNNTLGASGVLRGGSTSPKIQPRRPGFLRALTSESIGRRSLTSSLKGEDSKMSDSIKSGQKDRELNSPGSFKRDRSGSTSPRSKSSGSDKYILNLQNSPSLLRLEIPSVQTPLEDYKETKASPYISTGLPHTETEPSKALISDNTQTDQAEGKVIPLKEKKEEKQPNTTPIRVNSETTPSDLPSLAVSTTSSPIGVEAKLSEVPTNPIVGASKLTSLQLPTEPNPNLVEGVATRTRGISNVSSASRMARTRDDFYFGDLIGEGSYSTVMEAWDLIPLREKGISVPNQAMSDSNNALAAIAGKTSKKKQAKVNLEGAKVYAIKILDKVHILKERKQKYVSVEKEALSLLTRHPGVITLYWTFQDRDSLYFVLEMAPNGELLNWIKRLGSFNETCAKYYASQLLDTIQAVHKVGILHRDVKPENVLLDSQMHIRLADFGSAKIIGKPNEATTTVESKKHNQRPSSFVGTAEYVSPELLNDKQVCEASDYWALGCIIFQMLCGRPPFKGASEYQTFQKIMHCEFEFQEGFSESAKDLIRKLLTLNPDERPSYEEMKEHPFFSGVDWDKIWSSEAPILEAGLYKRPIQNNEAVQSLESSIDSQDDGISSATEDEEHLEKSADGLGQTSIHSESGDNSVEGRRDTADEQDADDDDSSLSDAQDQQSQQQSMFRKRGFSAGASAAERMLAQVSNTTKKGGNLFSKVTAGLSSNERNDAFGSSSKTQRSSIISGRQSSSVRSSSQFSGNEVSIANPINQQHSTEAAQFNASLATSWAALLLPHESLLYACPIVHKTSGALLRTSNKKRQLLLTDFPRLLCVKETNDQLKVKSEVILGMPTAMIPRVGTPSSIQSRERRPSVQHNLGTTQGSNEFLDDDMNANNEKNRILAIRSSRMRRQSSAGPLLPSSPTSPSGNSIEGKERMNPVRMVRGNTLSGKGDNGFPTISSQNSSSNLRLSMPVRFPNAHQSSPLTPTPSRSSYPTFIGSGTNSNNNLSTNESNLNSSRYASSFGSIVDVTQASPNVMTSIEAKSIRSFVVHTPARSYLYEDPSGDASHWIKSISLAARRHAQIGPPASFSTYSTIPN